MSVLSRRNSAPERRCQPTAERAARSTHKRRGRGVFLLLRATSDSASTDVLVIVGLRPRFTKARRSAQPGVKIELIDRPQTRGPVLRVRLSNHPLGPALVYRNIVRKHGMETRIIAEVNGLCVHSLRDNAATNGPGWTVYSLMNDNQAFSFMRWAQKRRYDDIA
jgi:hypothetical protein